MTELSNPISAWHVWKRVAGAINQRPVTTRWALGGPGAVLAALTTMAAMPLWMPAGAAGVNDIALPIILAPVIWAVPFFYACLAENLPEATLVIGVATFAQGVAVLVALA